MDNAPPESEDGSSSENSGTEDEEIGFSLRNSPGTPTKLKLSSPQRLTQRRPVISGTIGRCRTKDEEEEMTPRPSKKLKATSSTSDLGRTPRAAFTSDSSKHMSPVHDVSSCIPSIRGFQMSYLRRVPELALLAKRVVEAEAERRAREDRKKMLATVEQEKTSQGRKGKAKLPESRSCYRATSSSSSRMPGSLSTGMKEGEVVGPKMKRLFRFAIRQLHEEGSIIIWDGAARRISLLRRRHLRLPGLLEFSSSPSSARMDVGDDRLWKSGSSSMSTNGSSLVSTISMGTGEIGEYEGELSDPSPDEEAYISLTPPYLLGVVEKTIRDIMSHPPPRASKSSSSSMRRVGPHQALAAPPPGPTVTEILTHIRNNDGRWDRVGEWAVKEALEFGKSGGRVWCVGGGRWELCA